MKKVLMIWLASVVVLASCAPSIKSEGSVVSLASAPLKETTHLVLMANLLRPSEVASYKKAVKEGSMSEIDFVHALAPYDERVFIGSDPIPYAAKSKIRVDLSTGEWHIGDSLVDTGEDMALIAHNKIPLALAVFYVRDVKADEELELVWSLISVKMVGKKVELLHHTYLQPKDTKYIRYRVTA
jgi:hypothetical protein